MQPPPPSLARDSRPVSVGSVVTYALMLSLGVGGFLLIRHFGVGLSAPLALDADGFGEGTAKLKLDALMHLFLALALIIVTARALGAAFALLHQPPVIGEVIAGLLLGPSLLGRIAPGLAAYVLPASVAPFLGILAQVGVVSTCSWSASSWTCRAFAAASTRRW